VSSSSFADLKSYRMCLGEGVVIKRVDSKIARGRGGATIMQDGAVDL
jgi:hypothetical protein